ncbi:TetR/AcrR family transcriptional regulator [Cupriavidus taiwanensis]|uniref:TetR/AcrR family transcriptional regulator n=1 Tax=Cupriavidus taiwanensis TaxID=164546 RepID=UPI000E102524|nr:TetR/AcrR family transcriptional regulator [Cupriavidus taiwanensis]SOY61238.1 putative transcriptional regulator, TetR family [Cupriavidus taiwanensis]SOY61456.1 putative transcriptional regulator, TetR family [Cupriavidus taiwanensis]SOY97951.1 putative transcriptional regulator, TetR family [Cupriavidus taiwanensis]SOZ67784.1 putative transcriptional regulator, TetR family [Cupriavidus taiwanensis]SOZ84871.1 putative transcriptional regulator, TetR family [Cupriavidus taiwanensis]
MSTPTVREQLVEHALVLIRRRGFNGFSYRDLAELVGVKTSSIHYYFPSKDDLVLEAVREYSARKRARLQTIDTSLPCAEQARQYLAPLRDGACIDQACVVGMLSADVLAMPDAVRAAMQDFTRLNEQWLARLFEQAAARGAAPLQLPPQQLAQVVFGALQNGLISARLFGTWERVDAAAALLTSAMPVEEALAEA